MDKEKRPAPVIQHPGIYHLAANLLVAVGHVTPMVGLRGKMYAGASALFESATYLSPDFEEAQHNRTVTALLTARTIFRHNPDQIEFARRILKEAEDSLGEALAIQSNPGLYNDLTGIYLIQAIHLSGKIPDDELAEFSKNAYTAATHAISFDNKNPFLLFNQGIAAIWAGRDEDARACLKSARTFIVRGFGSITERDITEKLGTYSISGPDIPQYVIELWCMATAELVAFLDGPEDLKPWNERMRELALQRNHLRRHTPKGTMYLLSPINSWACKHFELDIDHEIDDH